MKRYFWAATLALLFSPSLLLAAESAAGFTHNSLWLSNTSAQAGEKITIYTVVYNSTKGTIEGDVEFDLDAKPLVTSHVSLEAGETKIVSTTWSSEKGTHSFKGFLKNLTGATG